MEICKSMFISTPTVIQLNDYIRAYYLVQVFNQIIPQNGFKEGYMK